MRLIVGSYPLFVFILVSARPNAPSTSTGVDENGAKYENSNNITNRLSESDSNNNLTYSDGPSKGMEIQSIQVESSMMASAPKYNEIVEVVSSTVNNDVGRAAVSTSPTPIGESLKTVTKQLLQSPTATDMVITDIRTPPKIQQQIELISPGKGEAVPVLIEEENNSFEKMNEQNNIKPSTPSSGLSTWILLNGDFSSTPYSYNKKPSKTSEKYSSTASTIFETSSKRPSKPTIEMVKITSTTEKIKQKEGLKKGTKGNIGVIKPVSNPRKPLNSTVKPFMGSSTPIPNEGELGKPVVTLQDSKFKNKTPVIVGRVPLPSKDKDKADIVASSSIRPLVSTSSSLDTLSLMSNMTRFGTPVVSFPHVPARIKPVSTINASKDRNEIAMNAPYTGLSTLKPFVLSTSLNRNITNNEVVQETTTQLISTTTDKKIKTSSQKKKKKKNKNRRNKPSKKTNSAIESKISVDMNATSKIPGASTSRPLSTRIYNYLAREVMPNVGIGVVGLMLTAGLAGLLLYPFGGGIAARRTSYERPIMSKYGGPGGPGGPHRPHHYYNPNTYNHGVSGGVGGVGGVGMDNGQPEEAVLGQVLTGMDYSPYSRERPNTGSQSSGIYDPNDNYNSPDVVGYAGESINPNTKYSTINVASNTNNVKYTKIHQQEPQEQKNPTFNSDTQTESSSSILNNADSSNQISPESKFSNMNIVSDTNGEQNFADNTSSMDRIKTYKADLNSNEYEKYSVQNYPSKTRVNSQEISSQYSTESNPAYNSNDNSYNNDFISYSASVGSVYNEDTGYAQPDVKNHRHESNTYQEYQDSKINTDIKKEAENDTNVVDQPSYSALEGIPNYNSDDSEDMYKDSSNYNVFNYRNDHGIIIEHGPRKLKLQKRSTQNEKITNLANEFNNEVDSVLPDEEKMPLDSLSNSIEVSTVDSKLFSNEIVDGTSSNEVTTDFSTTTKSDEITTIINKQPIVENIKGTQFNISDFKKPQQQNEDFSIVSIIRRITQFKLNLGLSILRSTSQAFARYMGGLQQRMESVVRAINDHYRSRSRDNSNPKLKTNKKVETESVTDNFVKISTVNVKDVEVFDIGSQKLEESSTLKVLTFSKESTSTISSGASSMSNVEDNLSTTTNT